MSTDDTPLGARPLWTATPAAERVGAARLTWVTVCLGLALLPHVATLPVWVWVTVLATASLRLLLAARGRDAPPRALRIAISLGAIGLLFVQLRTFNGLSAGTALLQAESFWLLGYLVVVCWLTTAALLRLNGTAGNSPWRANLRYAARILMQALPLAIAFWLFFPRFGGPLWQLPDEGGGATSGLSDSMSPGDIDDLAMSDEIAFRARFDSATPLPEERYWRGPVLHDFDGRAWRRSDVRPGPPPPLLFDGPAYHYTVSLEPHQHHWIFVLDWPSQWNLGRGYLTSDYMLVDPNPVSQPLDVIATSRPHARAAEPLGVTMRRRDMQLPTGPNPRSVALARQLRAAHADDMDFVHTVLDLFHDQPFYYTLTPPKLAGDSVDGFLFDTRRGFCGHYASAFAVLMRAAGIPARVVTGYHGGTYNRFADYWIVRQSDAHAWDEIWIEGRGWVRVDPTAMIAPERVDRGLNDVTLPGQGLASRWQQRTPWFTDVRLRLDALRLLWRERFLTFDQDSQIRLLAWLHVPEPDGQKLALVLAGCLVSGMVWLTWQVRRELAGRPRDPAARAYLTLCRRLAAVGLPRHLHEGPETYAARVAARRPDLGPRVIALAGQYSALRYAAATSTAALETANFISAVKKFRPRAGPRGTT